MPGSMLSADLGFPQFTAGQSTEEKLGQVQSYLYELVEQIRYTMANLGVQNFNSTELEELSELITEPVYMALYGEDGDITRLTVEAGQLVSRMESAEGNITELSQTSGVLMAAVFDEEGQSKITLTAQSLRSELSALDSSLRTEITQTVNGITLAVKGESGTTSVRLSDGVLDLSGVVTFSDLSGTGTVINGGNITTGTISGNRISGGTISGVTVSGGVITSTLAKVNSVEGASPNGGVYMYYMSTDYLAGGLRLDDQGNTADNDARYRMFLYTNEVAGYPFGLKLEGAGAVSLQSMQQSVYISAASYIRIMLDPDNVGDTRTITIGAEGQSVNLVGSVRVNGVLIQ